MYKMETEDMHVTGKVATQFAWFIWTFVRFHEVVNGGNMAVRESLTCFAAIRSCKMRKGMCW